MYRAYLLPKNYNFWFIETCPGRVCGEYKDRGSFHCCCKIQGLNLGEAPNAGLKLRKQSDEAVQRCLTPTVVFLAKASNSRRRPKDFIFAWSRCLCSERSRKDSCSERVPQHNREVCVALQLQGSNWDGTGTMSEEVEDRVRKAEIDARARNISHNVRCTECGSQSIEDSQADIAILLRKLIRDEIRGGKSDKEIYEKLEKDYGETILYAPRFDLQTAALWLSPVIVAGAAAGLWAYRRHQQRTNVHLMALRLLYNIPLTPKERQTMLELLEPPPQKRKWWR